MSSPLTTLAGLPKEKIIERIVTKIIVVSPGLANLLLWTKIEYREGTRVTSCNDGKNIFVMDPFFALPSKVQMWYVAHQLLHIALRHASRAARLRKLNVPAFNLQYCTLAQDLIINWSLAGSPHFEAPPGLATFESVLPSDVLSKSPQDKWSMEKLYKFFKDQNKTQPTVEEDVDFAAADDESPTEAESNDGLWQKRLERGMSLSGECKVTRRLAGDMKSTKTPWNLILKRYLRHALSTKFEACFSRPHRRTSAEVVDFFLPNIQPKQTIKEVAFIVDTSGSISDADIRKCLCEVLAVQRFAAANVRIISADCAVQTDLSIPANKATLAYIENVFLSKLKGGGGTDFRPAITLLEQKPPTIAVYLTDLCGAFPTMPPKYPLIWVSLTEQRAPFGITVHLDE